MNSAIDTDVCPHCWCLFGTAETEKCGHAVPTYARYVTGASARMNFWCFLQANDRIELGSIAASAKPRRYPCIGN